MYQGTEQRINDFSGGYVLNRPVTELELNESPDLDNIVVFGKGQGFRSRFGDDEFNGTTMVGATTAVTGLQYFKKAAGTEYLMAVAGTKIFKSEMDGTMDDITGSVTITTGQDNHWTLIPFNDKVIAFGGPYTSPDTPWIWTGTGNATKVEDPEVTISATNKFFDFNIGAAQINATVTEGTYAIGQAETDPGTLCEAVYTAIHAAEATGTYTVTYSRTTQKFTITRTSGTFQILFKTGTHGSDNTDTHIGTALGYSDAADLTGALTYTGTIAVAYSGVPPSAYGGFHANNRIFAYVGSTISWSILGNESNWGGTGSGSADVWTSDNDRITSHAVLNTNTVLLFKENSIHQMQIGSLVDGAFPIFPLALNIGCVGKDACVVWEGIAYFITPEGQMKATDGDKIYDSSDWPALQNIDPAWNDCNSARRKYIQGSVISGIDFEGIVWCVSYGSAQGTHNRAFVWDLRNKCWLQWSTGFKSNRLARHQNGLLYAGHYNGKAYLKDINLRATDDSEAGATISGYWSSGWTHSGKFETIKQPRKLSLAFTKYTTPGELRVFYGFDFEGLTKQTLVSQTSTTGGVWDTSKWDTGVWDGPSFDMKGFRLTGRGNFFQFKIQTPTAAVPMKIHDFSISGKEYGQKDIVH